MTLIWEGIGLIPDDRVPDGYIGIDGPQGLELIRLKFEVTVGEQLVPRKYGATEKSEEPHPMWQMIERYGDARDEWATAETGDPEDPAKELLDSANDLREYLNLPLFTDVTECY